MLAGMLDGQVVVLDAPNARVVLLDPRSERIWRACTGRSAAEIAARVSEAPSDVMSALRELAEAGLVSSADDRWTQAPLTWI